MLDQRIADLERQIAELPRGGEHVSTRGADGPAASEGAGEIASVISLVLSELRKEVPYDSCSVQELRGERLVIIGGVGFADLELFLGETFDLDNIEIPNGAVVYRRRPLAVGDVEQYRAFRRGLHVGSGIRSWLGVPMLHGESVYGLLALDKKEPDFYSTEHQQAALAFARLVASALARGNAQTAESSTQGP